MTDIQPVHDLQAGVAILTAAHQMLQGTMSEDELEALVIQLNQDSWQNEPLAAIWPVAYLAIRAASLAATATGSDVDTILAFLGAEVASLPGE